MQHTHSAQYFAGTDTRREAGNFLLLGLFMTIVLAGFVAAQSAVTMKNIRQADYFVTQAELNRYAESGAEMAYYDMRKNFTGSEGNLGTTNWTIDNDVGRDGYPQTNDEGEGDGIPTPGEPNVVLTDIGPTEQNIGMASYIDNTTYAGVNRVICAATDGETIVTVEKYARQQPITIPETGALFVDEGVALDLKGGKFLIDGNDYNVDGTPGPNPAVPGISVAEGTNPGENEADILSQIGAQVEDQVLGDGGEPSVGETDPGTSFDTLYSSLAGAATQTLAPGTYPDPDLGDWDTGDLPVTHVDGDMMLSGSGEGAGILVVNGSLTISGDFTFIGLVIVTGDLVLTGGGSGVHVYGGTMIGQTFTAVDSSEVTVTGNADLLYSSEAIAAVQQTLAPSYDVVYYEEK